jgi:hypothetical protein
MTDQERYEIAHRAFRKLYEEECIIMVDDHMAHVPMPVDEAILVADNVTQHERARAVMVTQKGVAKVDNLVTRMYAQYAQLGGKLTKNEFAFQKVYSQYEKGTAWYTILMSLFCQHLQDEDLLDAVLDNAMPGEVMH